MRPWECPQTDTQTHWQRQIGFIICPVLYTIAMGQMINIQGLASVLYYHRRPYRLSWRSLVCVWDLQVRVSCASAPPDRPCCSNSPSSPWWVPTGPSPARTVTCSPRYRVRQLYTATIHAVSMTVLRILMRCSCCCSFLKVKVKVSHALVHVGDVSAGSGVILVSAVRQQACSYFPIRKASPPLGQYQIINQNQIKSATALLQHGIQFLLQLKIVPLYTVSSTTSSLTS